MHYHQPILVDTFLTFFEGKTVKTYVDGTVGAGGHAEAILQAHPEIERFYGFDKDPDALALSKERLASFGGKVELIHGNFHHLDTLIPGLQADGIFLDLGVSSMQLDRPEKGFSFMREGPLDMRMDPTQQLTAAIVVNSYSQRDLEQILREYGEEPRWRLVAKTLVEKRRKRKIETTADLVEALKRILTWKGRRSNPMTHVFQALRIEVNDELGGLKEALPKVINCLAPQGRLGVLTFHSLEDRIVKQGFKEHSAVKILTKKPLVATREEIKSNKRSRSAKLRFAEKLE